MGINRSFQAKRLMWLQLCTVIKTAKFSLWVVTKIAPQTQNGRRPPYGKKTDKLLYFSNGLTDLDKILYADAHWPFEP